MVNLLWYLQRLEWIDILDIALVAFLFFWIFYLVRGTRAVPLLRGAIFLIIAVILLSGIIRLRAFGWLTEKVIPALLVAVPVLFQQEMRRALERLGRPGALFGRRRGKRAALEQTLGAVAQASRTLAEKRCGALIVLERETGLQELADSGVLLDAAITSELLVTIFDPHTMLHDGGKRRHRHRHLRGTRLHLHRPWRAHHSQPGCQTAGGRAACTIPTRAGTGLASVGRTPAADIR